MADTFVSGRNGGTGDGDNVPPRYVEGNKLSELWARTEKRFPESRRRIIFCRDLQRGAVGIGVPGTYAKGPELDQALIVSHPIKKTLPLQMTAKMARKFEKATLKRFPLAPNDGARKAATDFETWINGVVGELLNRRGVIGREVQQGELAIFVQPSVTEWQKHPDFMTTITGEDGKEERKPNEHYSRDAKGRTPKDDGYEGRNGIASAKAYHEDADPLMARRLPFTVRVESPLNCFPILARGRSKEPWDTIGIVVRTLYEREELIRRKYRWPGMDNVALIPTEADTGSGYGAYGQVYFYEAWMLDADDNPYISYSVGGHKTTMDDESPAIIDLKAEYGLTRLPCKYFWGNHLEDEPDERGVPLLDPIAVAILNVEAHLTHELLYGKRTAMPGFGVDVNPDLPPAAFLDDKGNLKKIEMPKDGGVILLPGRMAPLVAPRVGDSLRYVTDQLLGQVQQSTPDASVVGGGGGASGHQDVIQNEYFEASQELILESARTALEFVGEIIAELACTAARGEWEILAGQKVEIPVYINAEVTPGNDTAKTSTLRTISTFKERWVGPGIYDLKAIYPNEGNLAETQQTAELADRGYATFDDVMESRGKTAPEVERAKIDADHWLKSPEGQAYLSQRFAAYRGDLEAQETEKLRLEGMLSPGENPLPVDALAQQGMVPPGMPGQGGLTGMAMPNLAASALGGAVSSGLQTGPALNDATAQSMIPGGV